MEGSAEADSRRDCVARKTVEPSGTARSRSISVAVQDQGVDSIAEKMSGSGISGFGISQGGVLER